MMGLAALAVLAAMSGRCRWIRLLGVNLSLLTFTAVVATILYVGPQQVGEILYGIEGDTPIQTVVGPVTIAGRMDIWNRAGYVIWDFPVTGCGLGTFRQVMRDLYPLLLASPGSGIAYAHNMFLQVTLDLGLPGLVVYLALLGLAGVICWQVAWRGGETRWLALGLMAGLIGLHVYGLTDALALGSKPGLEFWLALGIVAGLAQMDGDKTECTRADAGVRD